MEKRILFILHPSSLIPHPFLIPVSCLQRLRHLALTVLRFQILTFIIQFLAFGKANLNLDQAVLEIEPERYDREAPLANPAVKTVDLPAVEQQLAVAVRLVILAVAEFILGYVQVMQEGLAVTY